MVTVSILVSDVCGHPAHDTLPQTKLDEDVSLVVHVIIFQEVTRKILNRNLSFRLNTYQQVEAMICPNP